MASGPEVGIWIYLGLFSMVLFVFGFLQPEAKRRPLQGATPEKNIDSTSGRDKMDFFKSFFPGNFFLS